MKILWTGTCPECHTTVTMQCDDAVDGYLKVFSMPCPNCNEVEPVEGEIPMAMVAEVLN